LMTKIERLEREIGEYDRQIGRIRADYARHKEDEPPDSEVGVRPRR
jgi:hypothetical protein